jgi:hypothetical protein
LPVNVKQLVSQWADFVILYSEKFYNNSVEKIQIALMSDKNIRYFSTIWYCYYDKHR